MTKAGSASSTPHEDGDFYNAGMDYYPSNLTDAGYEATMDENSLVMCSLLVEEDGNLYFSGWNGKTNVFYKLTFQEETKPTRRLPLPT